MNTAGLCKSGHFPDLRSVSRMIKVNIMKFFIAEETIKRSEYESSTIRLGEVYEIVAKGILFPTTDEGSTSGFGAIRGGVKAKVRYDCDSGWSILDPNGWPLPSVQSWSKVRRKDAYLIFE